MLAHVRSPRTLAHTALRLSHASKNNVPLLNGTLEDLRSVFVRMFRWDTVDVLQLERRDFVVLRKVVMLTPVYSNFVVLIYNPMMRLL